MTKKRKIPVRKHNRKLQSGETTKVRRHTRLIDQKTKKLNITRALLYKEYFKEHKLKGSRTGIPQEKQDIIPKEVDLGIKRLSHAKNEYGGSMDFEPGYLEQVEIWQGSEGAVINLKSNQKNDYEVDFHTHPPTTLIQYVLGSEKANLDYIKNNPEIVKNDKILANQPSDGDIDAFIDRKSKNKIQHFLIYPTGFKTIEVFVKDEKKFNDFINPYIHKDRSILNRLKDIGYDAYKKTPNKTFTEKDLNLEDQIVLNKVEQKDNKIGKKLWKRELEKQAGISFKNVKPSKLKVKPR